jgi:hypothetical protein
MSDSIVWMRARNMTEAAKQEELRNKLTESWNSRHVPEEE